MAERYGLEKLGFLTLTFRDNLQDLREAQRRFNSLNTGILRGRYARAIGCWERQNRGAVHFHLVVTLATDIRTGFDFSAIERRDYRSASPDLRSEWAFWRETAPRYGFGRTELLPIRSTAEGIARYVGSYVSAHVRQRGDGDKGARVVRFLGFKAGDRQFGARFAWNTTNGWMWRTKVRLFAESCGVHDMEKLTALFGPRWAYMLQPAILATSLAGVEFPTQETAEAEFDQRRKRDEAREARFKSQPNTDTQRNIYQLREAVPFSARKSSPARREGFKSGARPAMENQSSKLRQRLSRFEVAHLKALTNRSIMRAKQA